MKTVLLGASPSDDQERRNAVHAQLRAVVAGRFVELKDLHAENGRLVAGGQVFDRYNPPVLDPRGNIIDDTPSGFVDHGNGSFEFFTRSGSVADLEHRKRARDIARREAELERTARLRSEPRRPILLDDLEPEHVHLPTTLAGAAAAVVRDGGILEVHDGRLVVLAPPETLRGLIPAVRVLAAVEPLVVAALEQRSDAPLDARLPDKHVTATGALEP